MMHNHVWFTKVRGSYLPASWQAWLLYIPYTAYIVAVVVYASQQSADPWAAAFTIIPNWVAALSIMTWIAKRTTEPA